MKIRKMGITEDEDFSIDKLEMVADILEKQPHFIKGILTNSYNFLLVKSDTLQIEYVSIIAKEVANVLGMDTEHLGAMMVNDFSMYMREGVYLVERD